jgi:hypothetical protein
MQVAERLAVITPFGRRVAIGLVDPGFALGQAARKKFGKASKL